MKKRIISLLCTAAFLFPGFSNVKVSASSEATTAAVSKAEDAAEASRIYTEARKNMMEADSFSMKTTFEMETDGTKNVMTTEGTVEPKNNRHHMMMDFDGIKTETFMHEGYRFTKDSMKAGWSKIRDNAEIKVSEESLMTEESAALLNAETKEDGSVILKTKEPISIKEFMGSVNQRGMMMPGMEGMDGTVSVEIEITPDKFLKSISYVIDGKMEKMEGKNIKISSKTEYSNINSAEEIKIPEDAANAPETEEPGMDTPGEVTNSSKPQQ